MRTPGKVHTRPIYRTRGPRVSGQFFFGDQNHQVKKKSSHDARNMIVIQFCPSDSFAELTHSAACRSPLPAGHCGSSGVARSCALLLDDWAAATANAPDTAMPLLPLLRAVSGPGEATRVARGGVRGVELSDVALETVAGPMSALKSTAVASSAEASVASQSPSWADTSNLAPVPVFCCGGIWGQALVRNAERAPKQSHPSYCRSLWPRSAVSCGHRGDLSSHTRIVTPLLVAACDFKKIKNAF